MGRSPLRRDLFRAVVAEVPFVDCLTTILDETLPLTVTEWEEWGDPVHDPAVYDCMKSYSPYDNVVPGEYPAMLVTGGLNDPRVQYWEPAKWVAKLRTARTDNRLLVLKMEMGAGHSRAVRVAEAWRDAGVRARVRARPARPGLINPALRRHDHDMIEATRGAVPSPSRSLRPNNRTGVNPPPYPGWIDAGSRSGQLGDGSEWSGGNGRQSDLVEERDALLGDGPPGGEVVGPVGAVAVLVGMLEHVERGVLGIEELAVLPEERLVEQPCRCPSRASWCRPGCRLRRRPGRRRPVLRPPCST
jgi:hypothetical protein